MEIAEGYTNFDEPQSMEEQTQAEYPGQPQQDDAASIIRQIDPKKEIEKIEYELKGYVLHDGKYHKPANTKPLMNDEGVNAILSVVRSYVTLNTTLSNNKDDEISRIMNTMIKIIVTLLYQKKQAYDIRDDAERWRIMEIVIPRIYMAIKRSLNEGDKRFLKGQTVEHINRSFNGDQGGFWSKLSGFKKPERY